MKQGSWVAALLAVAVLGCGDDDGGDSNGSKKLSELSSAEKTSLCNDVSKLYDRYDTAALSVICTEQGRQDPATCSATRQQCITIGSGADSEEDDFSCQGSPSSVTSTCANITVDEMKACMNALLSMVESLASKYTCTADESALTAPTTPKACSDLGSRCPDLAQALDDTEDEDE